MYTVILTGYQAWLTDPADPGGASIQCWSRQGQVEEDLDGDVRYYAGGRVGGFSRAKDSKSVSVQLAHLSSVQVALLRSWRGRTLLFRTIDSDRDFVIFFNMGKARALNTVPDDATAETVTYDVDVTFTRVSYDETQ